VKAAPNRTAILDRTYSIWPLSSSSGARSSPDKIVSVDDYGLDSLEESSDEDRPKRPIHQWTRSK